MQISDDLTAHDPFGAIQQGNLLLYYFMFKWRKGFGFEIGGWQNLDRRILTRCLGVR